MADVGWLELAPGIRVRQERLVWLASRGGGPGGQHVNTTESRVQVFLRLADLVGGDAGFPDRLRRAAGSRLTEDGTLVLSCGDERSQHRNRDLLLERLQALVASAARKPRVRRASRPTRGSVERRLDAKKRQARTKTRRGDPPPD